MYFVYQFTITFKRISQLEGVYKSQIERSRGGQFHFLLQLSLYGFDRLSVSIRFFFLFLFTDTCFNHNCVRVLGNRTSILVFVCGPERKKKTYSWWACLKIYFCYGSLYNKKKIYISRATFN